jgi:Fur family ferric uptake transcriptional regulator
MKHFQRLTQQRRVILEELRNVTSHPTASALYEIVRCRLPKISLGTVYRNLVYLAKMGDIRKLEFSGAEARFDGNIHPHDHVRCLRCGRVDDVGPAPLALAIADRNSLAGYKVLDRRLEFLGVCPGCLAAEEGAGCPSVPS